MSDASPPSALPVQLFASFHARPSAELDAPFDEPLPRFRLRPHGRVHKVRSCRELVALPLSKDVVVEASLDDEAEGFWMTAIGCVAVDLVQSARPSRVSLLTELFASKDATRLLPPLLGLTDLYGERAAANAGAAHCRSLRSLDRTVRVKQRTPDSLSIKADDWGATIHFYARGDFDGDGYEDLLVRRDGWPEGGSYYASALFLLSRTEKDACIRVVREVGES